MKKKFLLFILFLGAITAHAQGIRNSILGVYSGTYLDYATWPNFDTVQAGVKVTALPNDTAGFIAYDTINNIIDTIFISLEYDMNHQFIVDTFLYYQVFNICGDIIPRKDSIYYGRCIQNENSGNPQGEVRLKAVSYTFPTSIPEIEKPKFTLYPNPAQDFVSIQLPENYTHAQLSIYNLTGQLISKNQITQPNQQIPITELGNGIYIFVIQTKDKIIGRQRVVVAR
jgi:hypothetical protein